MEIALWLIVAAIMVVLECISLGLTTIWFAGGALAAAIAAYFDVQVTIQIIVFIVVSLLMLVFTRPVAKKHLMKEIEPTNIDSFIGMVVDVLEDINGRREGLVRLNGLEWSAVAENDEMIAQGEEAVVKAIAGNKLIVIKKA